MDIRDLNEGLQLSDLTLPERGDEEQLAALYKEKGPDDSEVKAQIEVWADWLLAWQDGQRGNFAKENDPVPLEVRVAAGLYQARFLHMRGDSYDDVCQELEDLLNEVYNEGRTDLAAAINQFGKQLFPNGDPEKQA